jgi:hypothetical protein
MVSNCYSSTTEWTDPGPICELMFGVRKRINNLQSWLSQVDSEIATFRCGAIECGSLSNFLTSVTVKYRDRDEFMAWLENFREYLHLSQFNLWLLVLQQPGKSGMVEYVVDFSKFDIFNGDVDDILDSYNYYIDTIIGRTMLGFFTRYLEIKFL